MEAITIAIISGGQSRRFGADKTLAELYGKPLIQWVADGAASISQDVVVIAKNSEKYSFLKDVRFAIDMYEQQCPLVGLLTALSTAKNDAVFMISADMPLFPFDAISAMLAAGAGADVIIPDVNGKIYPCGAIYYRKDYDIYEGLFNAGNYRLSDAFKQVNAKSIPYELFAPYDKYGCAFTNVNRQEDLERLKEMMDEHSHN